MGYQDYPYQCRSTQPTKNFAYHPKFNEIGQTRSLPKQFVVLKMFEF